MSSARAWCSPPEARRAGLRTHVGEALSRGSRAGTHPGQRKAPFLSPDPSGPPPRLTMEVRACQHVPVGLHVPALRPQRWTPADRRGLHQQPARYCGGRGAAARPRLSPTAPARWGLRACARSALRAPSRWLYLSAQQCSEPGQVEGPAAIRARLCPQSELTACRCRVCCGQGPSWGTPVTCWTALCAWPTPSAGPGVRVERRPSPPSKPSPPSPHSQRLSGRLCPQPWLHPNFPQL